VLAKQLLSQIVDNDALTRGLGDPEARILVEWLVERAECVAEEADSEETVRDEVARLCRRGRSVSRFVALWCHLGERGAAGQLATAERLNWPLPGAPVDPCELMQDILDWEYRQLREFGAVQQTTPGHSALRRAA
jgi:hypothetical protein